MIRRILHINFNNRGSVYEKIYLDICINRSFVDCIGRILVLTLGKNENYNPVNDDNVQIVRKYEILKRDISYGIKTTAKFKVIDENSK